MELEEQMARLYEKDTKDAYASLLELEALSKQEPALYPYLDELMGMLKSERYVVRVRGFRLLCLQARWDDAGRMDAALPGILAALQDEKPTAVRQALQYLGYLAPYKKQLHGPIKAAAQGIDLSRFKDTMAPLIMKDVQNLVRQLEA